MSLKENFQSLLNKNAIFMYDYSFARNKLAFGASSAMVMLVFVMLFIVPYLYYELRKR